MREPSQSTSPGAIPSGWVDLDRAECLRLLAGGTVGRVLFTDAAMPAALPVGYVLDGELIVFRTWADSLLARAVHRRVVGFQVDHIDPATRAGWSVLGLGEAEEVTDPASVIGEPDRILSPGAPSIRTLHLPLRHITGSYYTLTAPEPR